MEYPLRDRPHGFTDRVTLVTSQARTGVLIAGLDLTAVRHAQTKAPCFLVHPSADGLRAMFDGYCLSGGSAGVLGYRGTVSQFVREVPVSPDAFVLDGPESLLAAWPEIPAGARILLATDSPAISKWVQAGFLEPEESSGIFRASPLFRQGPQCPPAHVIGSVHAALQRFYSGERSRKSTFDLTAPIRRWRLETATRSSTGARWPHRNLDSLELPPCLPDGSQWPLISIVTPSFNQGKYIEETILSVANQRYPRVEHIVMDGGSNDETAEILQRHRWRLAAAVSEKDRGQSHAINKGMALANGEILTWLNSDDMLAPGALSAVAFGFWMAKADLVAGVVRLMAKGETTGFHMTCAAPGPLPLDDLLDLDGGWNAGRFFYQPEVMFSRDIWERAGGKVREDLYYSMDYDLWVRMAEAKGRLHVIGREVAWFRLHEEQKTNVQERFKAELSRYIGDYQRSKKTQPQPSKARPTPRHRLRVTLLNDHGFHYGAGIAHRRLGETLLRAGHAVEAVKLRLDPPVVDYGTPLDRTAEEVVASVAETKPDLVLAGNVHSAGASPWHMRAVASLFPTVALVHDFWWVTGRCAYPRDCSKYLKGCDDLCPTADEYPKLSPEKIAGAWASKRRVLGARDSIVLAANSTWTQQVVDEALAATGRPTVTGRMQLPFPLETFVPTDRRAARAILQLPMDRFIVLLTGDLYDPRKNTRLALDAMGKLNIPELTVVSLGFRRDGEDFGSLDTIRPGHMKDPKQMALYYAAADVFVGPSEVETFGQVFIESIACGTPAIAYNSSGMKDALVDNVTGVFIDELTPEHIAAAVMTLYRQPERRSYMAGWGRLYVENEWSNQKSYYTFHRMLEDTGIAERLQLAPKISFLPEAPALHEPRDIDTPTAIQVDARGLGDEEGPYPDLNLGVFRWAFGPRSRLAVQAIEDGMHSVVIRYRTVFDGQKISVKVNGGPVGRFALRNTGIKEDYSVCFGASLQRGSNSIEIEYERWLQPGESDRPLAMAVTEVWAVLDVTD